jgi:hypothetical protein
LCLKITKFLKKVPDKGKMMRCVEGGVQTFEEFYVKEEKRLYQKLRNYGSDADGKLS